MTKRKATTAVQSVIVTRKEAAELLSKTPRTLDAWAREGVIKKIFIPGKDRVNAIGFRRADVMRLAGE